jgi:hypothetical protein
MNHKITIILIGFIFLLLSSTGAFAEQGLKNQASTLAAPQVVEESYLLKKFTFYSQARGKNVSFYAFLPKSNTDRVAYPVLFLLHGAWDDYTAWKRHAQKNLKLLTQKYGLIIVTPDGDPFGWYADSPYNPSSQIETYFIKELIPFVDKNLNTNGRRSIAGLSMGGHGALTLALRNPGVIISASSMSGILDITLHPTAWELPKVFGDYVQKNYALWQDHSAFYLVQKRQASLKGLSIMITVSVGDKVAIRENRLIHELLKRERVKHRYEEAPGGHDWTYWSKQLPAHVAFHIQALKGGSPKF